MLHTQLQGALLDMPFLINLLLPFFGVLLCRLFSALLFCVYVGLKLSELCVQLRIQVYTLSLCILLLVVEETLVVSKRESGPMPPNLLSSNKDAPEA